MRRFTFKSTAAVFCAVAIGGYAATAFAIDGDDELKTDDPSIRTQFKRMEPLDEELLDVKKLEVLEALEKHFLYANEKNLEAYLDTFALIEREARINKRYAERVMALEGLALKLMAVEFEVVQPKAALVHVRQRASYHNGEERVVDDAIISYSFKVKNGEWKIVSTERKRLVKDH